MEELLISVLYYKIKDQQKGIIKFGNNYLYFVQIIR